MSEVAHRLFALVPAAGSGSRAGQCQPKQYVPIAGRPLLAHTLEALAAVPELTRVAVVLAPEDTRFEQAVPDFEGWVWRTGGATRAASVAAGLQGLRAQGALDADWVLVHDAARCLLRPQWVRALLSACRDDAVGGLLAQPIADTLKLQQEGACEQVERTVSRERMWAAQTPQMFRLGLLEDALAKAGEGVTDEASAVERLGHAPRLVRAALENFKVTLPEDFALAEALLKARKS
ncbi:MAG: 2-C-methyl-D-erythritol 4-phosphate cytidylyltransferase [Burkholderiales bacterium]|nr:2-C-methyl-D-erythritol 4-phosphate cytidylyltransferase [Burkholderiales bacterium]